MLKRSLTLALLAAALLCAKTYKFSISEPMTAGGVRLEPGPYTVKVEKGSVVLLDKKGARIDVKMRVETEPAKAVFTSTVVAGSEGQRQLKRVLLENTKDAVVFE